jgi:uncharacterized membrane protein YphA (DoxX/SURF4 family)
VEADVTNDTMTTRMTAVILRATLAAIFIWHGVDKVFGPSNNLGATWAEPMWRRSAEPPPEILAKLKALPPRAWLTDEDKTTNPTESKVAELAESRFNEAKDQLRRAYVESAPAFPEAMSFSALQYAVAWGELLGGVALLIGLLTRLAALGLILIQIGAIYFVTGALGMSNQTAVGYEYNLALVAMCLVLVIMGPGAWSVDRFLHWGRNKPAQKPAVTPPSSQPVAAPS